MYGSASHAFSGLDLRLRRMFRRDGRTLIVALDHATTLGPVGTLRRPHDVIRGAVAGDADAVLLRPGLLPALRAAEERPPAVIMALTGRLTKGVDHVALNSVEHAVRCGADAVNGEFKFGSDGDLENVAIVASLAEDAHRLNIPVLVTVYTLPNIVEERGPKAYAHGCRIAEELGADIIKTSLPDDESVIGECVESVAVPIVVAGGDPRSGDDLAGFLRRAFELGVAGAAVGRNAWMAPDPAAPIADLVRVVHGDAGG